MRYSDLLKEVENLILTAVRSRTISGGAVIIDPVPLAEAWLRGEEDLWTMGHRRDLVSPDEMPAARIARGDPPFSSGHCSGRFRRTSGIHLAPPFQSPGFNRAWGMKAADAMSSFDPVFGDQRFTALHEVGHWLALDMRLDDVLASERSQERNRIVSEAMADGFAVAWAVAKGADPVAVMRDVGVHRACLAVQDFDPNYLTFGILQPASEIGLRSRSSGRIHPWGIIDQIHVEAIRKLPSRDFILEIRDKTWEEFRQIEEAKPIVEEVTRLAWQQPSWKRSDERGWWERMLRENSEHATTFAYLPVATILARMSTDDVMSRRGKPSHPELTQRLSDPSIRVLDQALWENICAATPLSADRSSVAGSIRKIAGMFPGRNGVRIRESLEKMAKHVEIAEQNPSPRWLCNKPVKGIGEPIRRALLVEGREAYCGKNWLDMVADRISGERVRDIAIVAETEDVSNLLGKMLRIRGDSLLAKVHAMPPAKLMEKRESIQAAMAKGTITVLGDVPEIRQRDKTVGMDR